MPAHDDHRPVEGDVCAFIERNEASRHGGAGPQPGRLSTGPNSPFETTREARRLLVDDGRKFDLTRVYPREEEERQHLPPAFRVIPRDEVEMPRSGSGSVQFRRAQSRNAPTRRIA